MESGAESMAEDEDEEEQGMVLECAETDTSIVTDHGDHNVIEAQ